MTEARSSSGVRNLRAMFENNSANASPEPRGRSPSRRLNTDVNRPTSKVKASFISVVPPTGLTSPVSPSGLVSPTLGTTKGTEHNSLDAQRRESFSVDPGAEAVAELKKVVSEEKEARKNSNLVDEVIPEQAVESREPSATRAPPVQETVRKMPSLGVIMKGSEFPESQTQTEEAPKQQASEPKVQPTQASPAGTAKIEAKLAALSLTESEADNPDKIVTGAQEEASLKPADPKDETLISGDEASQPPIETQTPSEGSEAGPVAPEEVLAANESPKTPEAKGASPAKANGKISTKKPAPISVAKTSSVKPSSAKSPPAKTTARQPRTPTTPRGAHAPAAAKPAAATKAKPTTTREVPKTSVRETSRNSAARSATASATAGAASKAKAPAAETRKPATKPTTSTTAAKPGATSPTGFKKPKPKSPTRPVRLPSHLTAPTAAFAAKHGEEAATKAPAARKPATTTTRPTTTKPATSTARTTSTARKPASHSAAAAAAHHEKRPASRASTAGASEGFLARMMRPTASSASKVHDKPGSPPRRSNSTRVAAKAKPGAPESTVAKAKKKVEEVAAKAKDVITSDHKDDHEEKNGEQGAEHTDTIPAETTQPASEAAEDKQEVTEKQDQPAEAGTQESSAEQQHQHDVSEKQEQAPALETPAQEAH